MPDILFADFETRSPVDLRKCGADVYARHPETSTMAFGFAFDDDDVKVVKMGYCTNAAVYEHIALGKPVVAHNASFEYLIWNYVYRREWPGLPELKHEQLICTMAMSYAMALPGSLEFAAAASGINIKKDMDGYRVMMQLCKPRDDGSFWEPSTAPEKFERMYKYCGVDVGVERLLYKRLMKLSAKEREVWCLDQKINQRGVLIDSQAVEAAIKLVDVEKDRLDLEMRKVTKNHVDSCSAVAQIKLWLLSRGVDCAGVAKNDVADLLVDIEDLPDDCRQALMLRQHAAKSSNAKLVAMVKGACNDGRVRGLFQYHGAQATGRWAGRRIQLHNLTRSQLKQNQITEVFRILKNTNEQSLDEIGLLYGNPLSVISDCLRGFLISRIDNDFISSDFSNIEGRTLAWLAGEEWKIKAFENFDFGVGPDIYKLSAQRIYGKQVSEIDSHERLIGKVAELALGYQGGRGAFLSMAKVYLLKVPEAKADEIKEAWRVAHPKTKAFWYELERAAMTAVYNKNKVITAGQAYAPIKYKVSGSFLWCSLPSNRVICYPYPVIWKQIWATLKSKKGKSANQTFHGATEQAAIASAKKYALENGVELVETSEAKDCLSYMGEVNSKWERQIAYGGLLANNVTQATARDILAEAMLRVEKAGYPIVMHVHDEILSEIHESCGSIVEFEKIMSEVPHWATGLPIVATEGWRDKRYRK